MDELTTVGHFVDEFHQVNHILDSLPEEYDSIVVNVAATNHTALVLATYVHGNLLNMEM